MSWAVNGVQNPLIISSISLPGWSSCTRRMMRSTSTHPNASNRPNKLRNQSERQNASSKKWWLMSASTLMPHSQPPKLNQPLALPNRSPVTSHSSKRYFKWMFHSCANFPPSSSSAESNAAFFGPTRAFYWCHADKLFICAIIQQLYVKGHWAALLPPHYGRRTLAAGTILIGVGIPTWYLIALSTRVVAYYFGGRDGEGHQGVTVSFAQESFTLLPENGTASKLHRAVQACVGGLAQ